MDFRWTEQQRMLKDAARNFLKDECPSDFVREMEEDGIGYGIEMWSKMAELGWMGLALPEAHGGTGWGLLDLMLMMEEMGRACVPGPYLETVLGALAVLEAGTKEHKSEILPEVASGRQILSLAYLEADCAMYVPHYVVTAAVADGEDFVLNGTKLFVSDAHAADQIIVSARTGSDSSSMSGITLFLVPRTAPGIALAKLKTIAGDKQFEVSIDGVRIPRSSVLGKVDEGWPVLRRILQVGALAKCAEMVGGAEKVLEMTVEYAKERVQFGSVIGKFQAVQHHCANMLIDLDGSRYITYKAAWLMAESRPCDLIVASAKAYVSEACRRVAALGHQIGGGTAYMSEHDMTLFSRRAKAAELAFGDGEYHLQNAATAMGL